MMIQLKGKLFVAAVAASLLSGLVVYGQHRFSDWADPVNLGATVNSAVIDQHPAISKDGLVFTSSRIDPTA